MNPLTVSDLLSPAEHSCSAGLNREITVRLAGNPNVGKSTVFNALTGLHQHTGYFNYGEI